MLKRQHRGRWLLAAVFLVALLALPAAGVAGPSVGAGQPAADGLTPRSDNLEGPLAKKQGLLMEKAIQMKLNGQIGPNTKIGKVAKGQYVELVREGEDEIWTVLAEFGDEPATHNHGALGDINHGGDPGPLHNQISEPDRSVDNTTIWAPDFSRSHYLDLLFSDASDDVSMRNFYKEMSNNRYAVDGDVTDWVRVPFNEAAYGSNYCGSIVCSRDIQRLLEDELNAWYDAQIAAGKTAAEIDDYLSRFDHWDRYDYNHNGNFDEPDGYIDHFQSIHAGEGEETGGGAQGTDAIWSHRSYTNLSGLGSVGPDFNRFGGVQVGRSGYWVGDYTIEPENGGVGVFSHEFGHDLGLPDEYDTSGNTGGAENGTAWWTIMSQGSYGTDGTEDLGSKPIGFNAWDKFQLGWLNYDVASAGQASTHKLGPSVYNTKQAQGLFVVLPPEDNPSTTVLGKPTSGANAWYSTAGNDLDVTMTRDVTLPDAGNISLTANAWYEIEGCWDYAYVRVSTDGGATYTELETNHSTSDNENGQNFGHGITGISGQDKVCDVASGSPDWVPLTADLTSYAGQTIKLQFRYWTDGAAGGRGFEFDDLAITADGATVFADDAESGENGWTLDGFRSTTGNDTLFNSHYYVVENRQYAGTYDSGLETGPYQFCCPNKPKLVEHFPYQDGILISYWDTGYSNNNVGDHPGEGLILPIDARPAPLHWSDGILARPRLQSFDATFGLTPTDPITVHSGDATLDVPSHPAEPLFDDLRDYWFLADEHGQHGGSAADHYKVGWNSVDVPHTGTQIRVTSQTPGGFAQILVGPSK
ncbi:MAG TPA: immune inhibitor A domain-containing protein [Gaiellaceae bacterium]|nr:immune inhibitor A domain-containing protein [Gaiellaceae bacterium]